MYVNTAYDPDSAIRTVVSIIMERLIDTYKYTPSVDTIDN